MFRKIQPHQVVTIACIAFVFLLGGTFALLDYNKSGAHTYQEAAHRQALQSKHNYVLTDAEWTSHKLQVQGWCKLDNSTLQSFDDMANLVGDTIKLDLEYVCPERVSDLAN